MQKDLHCTDGKTSILHKWIINVFEKQLSKHLLAKLL